MLQKWKAVPIHGEWAAKFGRFGNNNAQWAKDMIMLPLTSLKSFMVQNADGSVDHAASHAKLTAAICEFELRQGDDASLAATAISAVFDQFKGARLSMSFLVSQSLSFLKATPENHKVLTAALEKHVRSNIGEPGAALYGQAKGRGGGTWRHSDQAAAPATNSK